MDTIGSVFGRHRRLIFFIVGIIIAFWLLYALRTAILPFVLGLAFAYLLLPAISWVEKKLPRQGKWLQTKRISLILLSFIVILGLVGFFSYFIVAAVLNAFLVLVENAPQYISAGLFTLGEWAEGFRKIFPPEMQLQINTFIVDAGEAVGNAIRNMFMRGISFIPTTFSLIFGFVSLPIFLFYILKDSEKLQKSFYSALSPWLAQHTRNIILIIEKILGRYLRAQLMLGFFVAYLCLIGLLILRIDFAPALAALAGLTELIPILGPWIGGAAAVIVTLALAPEKAIWVALLFFLVQLLENNLLVPRIQGSYLHIHPALIMVLLVLGAYVGGIWGIIFAVPLTSTVMEIYKYVRQSIRVDETQELPQLMNQ
ncbi:AI-2E family transporter [Chloroflexota bacterium]